MSSEVELLKIQLAELHDQYESFVESSTELEVELEDQVKSLTEQANASASKAKNLQEMLDKKNKDFQEHMENAKKVADDVQKQLATAVKELGNQALHHNEQYNTLKQSHINEIAEIKNTQNQLFADKAKESTEAFAKENDKLNVEIQALRVSLSTSLDDVAKANDEIALNAELINVLEGKPDMLCD